MEARFKIGETVYVKSRYDGIVKRTVKSIIEPEFRQVGLRIGSSFLAKNNYGYELDDTVQISKSCKIGTHEEFTEEAEYIFPEMDCSPAPEFALMKLGDRIYDTHPIFRGLTDGILTLNHINQDDSKL